MIEHAELIWQAKKGECQALENLFRLYYDTLYRVAYKLTWNKALAQDLVQETMVSAIKGFKEYRMECQFIWWLKKILHRRYVDYLRGIHNEVALDLADEIARDESSEIITAIKIKQVFAEFPSDLRKTAELRFLMEYDIKEIARELKIPAGTVKSRLSAIKQTIKEKLGPIESIQI